MHHPATFEPRRDLLSLPQPHPLPVPKIRQIRQEPLVNLACYLHFTAQAGSASLGLPPAVQLMTTALIMLLALVQMLVLVT